MSIATNESIEYCILNDGYKPTEKEVKDMAKELWNIKHKKPNYEKAYNILMDYFDSISDEEKPKVDKMLKRCGL